jgi:hypothetical protein
LRQLRYFLLLLLRALTPPSRHSTKTRTC